MRKSLMKFGKPNRHDALSLLGTQDLGWGPSAEPFTPEHTLQASGIHSRTRLESLGWGRTQASQDLGWQVISVFITSPPHPGW